jgi:opacity protein-like surface antigen
MKKFATLVAAAAALTFVSGAAVAGPVYLWGMNAKGKTVKAGKYGRYTRLYTAAQLKKRKASIRKAYSHKTMLCGKAYMLSKRQQSFMAAHRKAKHMVVVRERVGRGKYKKLCDA